MKMLPGLESIFLFLSQYRGITGRHGSLITLNTSGKPTTHQKVLRSELQNFADLPKSL